MRRYESRLEQQVKFNPGEGFGFCGHTVEPGNEAGASKLLYTHAIYLLPQELGSTGTVPSYWEGQCLSRAWCMAGFSECRQSGEGDTVVGRQCFSGHGRTLGVF